MGDTVYSTKAQPGDRVNLRNSGSVGMKIRVDTPYASCIRVALAPGERVEVTVGRVSGNPREPGTLTITIEEGDPAGLQRLDPGSEPQAGS